VSVYYGSQPTLQPYFPDPDRRDHTPPTTRNPLTNALVFQLSRASAVALGLYRQDPYVATYNLPTATFPYIFPFKYHFKRQCELNRIEYRIL